MILRRLVEYLYRVESTPNAQGRVPKMLGGVSAATRVESVAAVSACVDNNVNSIPKYLPASMC